jgi:hypothetical protein
MTTMQVLMLAVAVEVARAAALPLLVRRALQAA